MKLKRILSAVAAFALCASLAGCGASASSAAESAAEPASSEAVSTVEEASPETSAESAALRVAGLKGPTTMGLVNMLTADDAADTIDFNMYGAADEVVPLLVKGDIDAAAVPANLAATLYQKTNGAVEVACVNTLGVLYIVENGETVNSVADLKGQTLVTTGKGTTPEYVLRYVLSENGLDPDTDVTIEYCSEATEALSKVQAGEATIAMLPQPFVTSALAQVEGLRVALDMNEEWQKVAGSKLVTGVLVVRKDAVEADADRFAAFMDAYQASVDAANTDLEGTAALCEEYGIVAKAALAQKALPQCNIVFETGDQMKTDLTTYYQVLFDADPTRVGGTMPADDFYYAGEILAACRCAGRVGRGLAAGRCFSGAWRAVPRHTDTDVAGAGSAGAYSCILAAHRFQRTAHPGRVSVGRARWAAAGRTGCPLVLDPHFYRACHAAHPRHAGRQLCHFGFAVGAQRQPLGGRQLHPCAAGGLRRGVGRHCRY